MSVYNKKSPRWSDKECLVLRNGMTEGISVDDIAKKLGRSVNSVSSKWYRISEGVEVSANEVVAEPKRVEASGVRESAKEMARVARGIARSNGKRITMAMFFVEDLD